MVIKISFHAADDFSRQHFQMHFFHSRQRVNGLNARIQFYMYSILRTHALKIHISSICAPEIGAALCSKVHLSFEPVHEISNNVVCATSKASDQPAHTRSLIRAFASLLSIL